MSIRRAQDERIEGTPDGLTAVTEISDVPDAPIIGAVADLSTGSTASVAYTAATTGGTATTFTATSSPGGLTGTGSSPITVSGLSTGVAYTFTVTASNSTGSSVASAASSSLTLAALGVYESIASVTVGAGGSATISFTSIPATYKHLQVRLLARGGRSDSEQYAGGIYFQFNSNFLTSLHQIRANSASSVAAAQGWSGGLSNGFIMVWVPASNAQANTFGVGIIDILDYANTNKNKVARILSGNELNANGGAVALTSGSWDSTSAITSITFGPTDGTGTIPQYSEFALYGIKGS